MNNFWDGFYKESSVKKVNSSVRIVGPRPVKNPTEKDSIKFNINTRRTDSHMSRIALRQPVTSRVLEAYRKLMGFARGSPMSKGEARDKMVLNPGDIGGIYAKGKKGTRSYIHRSERAHKTIRDLVHHEGFHAKVPILGESEALAHFYGGAKHKKGKFDIINGFRRLGHLHNTRPIRAAMETGPIAFLASKLIKKAFFTGFEKRADDNLLERFFYVKKKEKEPTQWGVKLNLGGDEGDNAQDQGGMFTTSPSAGSDVYTGRTHT